jgi:outer membrane protein OmpA-like peptidoglycan-associated protein
VDEPVKPDNGGQAAEAPYPSPEDPLGELRGLLLAADHGQVVKLQERLDDPQSRAEDVSRVLPEAIAIRSREDRTLTDSLLPTVEEAIGISVRRHPEVLVDGLFPVMGPAIRKSIASTLADMLESLNQTLGQSFSRQGLRWRFEAWRTGKPFSEVVLLRTLLYRVEQVFLIHRKTGLLLAHVSAGGSGVQDADMVSGMLTAIRDFVRDSFGGAETDALDAFRVGERTVWIEQGPEAVLAGVIQGNPPRELRTVFAETIEKIHRDQARALEDFEGDAAPFQACRGDLEACLKSQRQPGGASAPRSKGARRYRPLFAALALLLAAVGLWAFSTVSRNRKWEAYLERLAAQPGIVVTASGRRGGKFFVTGLRDPLAADPAAMLAPAKLRREDVVASWKPYHALDGELVAARARSVLAAPQTVSFRAENGALLAAGTASHRWIEEARKLARAIPGVARYDDRGLADTDKRKLDSAQKRLEATRIFFARGSSEPAPNETAKLDAAAREIAELPALAAAAGRQVRVEVVGRGDSEGTDEINVSLSRRRAERVLAVLRANLPGVPLAATGVGSSQPLVPERTEEDKQLNRSVSFRAVPSDPRPPEAEK